MMRTVGRYLPRVLCIVGLSLLLIAPALAESVESAEAPASEACTTRTGLHCEIYGSGDPILFLHGLGGSLYSWRNQKTLSAQYKVVLIDFRGAGDSPKPNDKHYSIKEQADLIYEFIHEHNLNNLTIVGNSYGGAVSLLLALKLGEEDRLSNLILINAGAYRDHLPSHLKILRVPIIGWLAVHLIPSKAQVRRVLRDSYYAPCKITREQIAAYARPIAARGGRHALLQLGKQAIPKDFDEIVAKYPTIQAHTLILWGEADRLLRRDVAERLDRDLPNSTLEFIKFAGHIPQEEQPEATNCRIKAFLNPTITCPPQTPEPPNCRR